MTLWALVLLCCVGISHAVLLRPSSRATSLLSQGSMSDILAMLAGNRFLRNTQLAAPTTTGTRKSGSLGRVGSRTSTGSRSLNRNRMLRTMYANKIDAQEFIGMTAMNNPRLAGTAVRDHMMNINGLPSYRYVMALDPNQPQYQKARQYVQLTGLMDSRGSDFGMRSVFSRLLQSTDPTIQGLLRIDAIDGAFGDVAKRLAMAPGGFQMLKKMGPLMLRMLS